MPMNGEDESDQLPESGPGGQTPDDASGSSGDTSRKEATENPGGPASEESVAHAKNAMSLDS